MKIIVVAIGCLLVLSCSRDPRIVPDPTHPSLRPLPRFTVTVVDHAPAKATIEWDEVVNMYNLDTVKYAVSLNGRTVDSNLLRLTDILTNLSPDSTYNGRVYAYTKSGDTASAPFRLEKLKGFVFFGESYSLLSCYDVYSGGRVWQAASPVSGYFEGIPTIANNVLYINGSESGTYAYNAQTGTLIWHTTFSSRYPNGSSVNPVCANGKVYTVMPGGVYALNSTNGNVIWSYPDAEDSYANPVMAGNLLITAAAISSQSKITALDAETGSKGWDYTVNSPICDNPVVSADLLIFGALDGKIYALNNKTGALVWSKDFSVNYNNLGSNVVSPVLYRDLVIVHNGNSGYYGLKISNGDVVWNYKFANAVVSSPAVGNDMVYFSSYYIAYALKAATGELVWQHQFLNGTGTPTPVCVNNRLYFRNETFTGIVVLNALTGDPVTSLAGNALLAGLPIVMENDTTHYPAQSGMVQ